MFSCSSDVGIFFITFGCLLCQDTPRLYGFSHAFIVLQICILTGALALKSSEATVYVPLIPRNGFSFPQE